MDKKDYRSEFQLMLISFDAIDLLLEKIYDKCALESKSSVYNSYEFSVQSAFKALRGVYNVLNTYARDFLVGDDKITADRLKIFEQRHRRLVYQRGRFEQFLKVCRLCDGDEISLFDFGEGFAFRACIKNGTEKEIK